MGAWRSQQGKRLIWTLQPSTASCNSKSRKHNSGYAFIARAANTCVAGIDIKLNSVAQCKTILQTLKTLGTVVTLLLFATRVAALRQLGSSLHYDSVPALLMMYIAAIQPLVDQITFAYHTLASCCNSCRHGKQFC